MIDGRDAHWLLQIVKPRLLDLHRSGVLINERVRRLVAELEQLDERHRDFAAAKCADLRERNGETTFSAESLLSTSEVATLVQLTPRRVQQLARAGSLEAVPGSTP